MRELLQKKIDEALNRLRDTFVAVTEQRITAELARLMEAFEVALSAYQSDTTDPIAKVLGPQLAGMMATPKKNRPRADFPKKAPKVRTIGVHPKLGKLGVVERDSKPQKAAPSPAPTGLTTRGNPRIRPPRRCGKCGELGRRSDTCGITHNVSGAKRTEDDDSEGEPRAARRPSRATEPAPEMQVIPHAALVRMLAAEREDALIAGGGIPMRAGELSLIGHTENKREHCPVHGWVGRVAYERDTHEACRVTGKPCNHCAGSGFASTYYTFCDRCGGTGVEPEHDDAPHQPPPPVKRLIAVKGVELVKKDGDAFRNSIRVAARAVTLPAKKITQRMLAAGELEVALAGPPVEETRPKTRGECAGASRPCPWVSCKHHLYLDVDPETGAIKFNFPDVEPEDLIESCSLDLADRGGLVLEDVANTLNLTRERVRQIEVKGFNAARAAATDAGIDASDAYFPHPQGNEHVDAVETVSAQRKEVVRRAQQAYADRQRRIRASRGGS